jgi:mannose-6-phosphate isomerase-like protein (cupin superfamily)
MTITRISAPARTSLHVDAGGTEIIHGGMFPWGFRPHFHNGQEIVHMLQGRARPHLCETVQIVTAGDIVMVPAKTVHRFEPIEVMWWTALSPGTVASCGR